MKFVPSVDGSQLVANNETFTRIHSMNYSTGLSQPASTIIQDIPPLIGADFTENSGKVGVFARFSCYHHCIIIYKGLEMYNARRRTFCFEKSNRWKNL